MTEEKNIWALLGGDPKEDCLQMKDKQLRITNQQTGENQIFAPTIYQSCMNPQDIRIYEMKIRRQSERRIEIQTHYGSWEVDLSDKLVEVTNWEAKIHKVDCKKCENCGRCGW